MKGKGRKQHGFTLIELLVTVAIILVIVAIAIPSYLSAKKAANDASIGASMRSVNTAEELFARQCFGSYAAALSNLGPAAGGGASNPVCTEVPAAGTTPASITQANGNVLGDAAIVTAQLKNNYALVYVAPATNGVVSNWAVTATLNATTTPTSRSYCIDNSSNSIHFKNAGTAFTATNGVCEAGDGNL